MLRQFTVKNFKCFNQEFVLDLSQTKNYEFNHECVENGIVSKAMIYGPNGCGKSNLGLAIFELHNHLSDNKVEEAYHQHYLNAANESIIAEFAYIFEFAGRLVEYRYGKKSAKELVYESVKIAGKQVLAIDRRESDLLAIDLLGAETLNRHFPSANISAIKYVLNNAVLSENDGRFLHNKCLRQLYASVDTMYIGDIDFLPHVKTISKSQHLYDSVIGHCGEDGLRRFEAFLNDAGVACKLAIHGSGNESTIVFDYGDKQIDFLQAASSGTISLCMPYIYIHRTLISERIKTLNLEGVSNFVFFDEFDAYYHHKAAKAIVNMLKQANCQVILTTHNTSIMTNDLLRPDCYFIMDDKSAKPIYQFTDKELRKAHNIEKMYKAGTFS